MTNIESIDKFLDNNLESSIDELKSLVAIPSVSAKGTSLDECSQLVEQSLLRRGFSVQVHQTDGSPIITAERKGLSDKTLLFYDHYDVQPPESMDLWKSPPFEPQLQDGKLFGRGTSDNKGDIINRLFTIDSLIAEAGELPCNIKFLIEGEEEVSSINISAFVENNKDLLAADGCIWEFGSVDYRGVPMQYLGLRGICYVQLDVTSLSMDVHSGLGGSIFPNAAWRLVWALQSLKDSNEKIQIDGFYDNVIAPNDIEIEYYEQLPDMAQEYKNQYGVKEFLKGINGGTHLNIEQSFKPTCTICGLTSGYQGEGSKTIMPSSASAKIDFRLVPNQKPERILELLRLHLNKNGFEDVKINDLGGEPSSKTNPEDPFVKLAVDTARDVYGMPMQIVPMSGGSGPNYIVQESLDIPIISMGVSYPGSGAHSPNENIRIIDYLNAAKHLARFIIKFGNR